MILIDTDVMVDVMRQYAPAVAWLEALDSETIGIPGLVASGEFPPASAFRPCSTPRALAVGLIRGRLRRRYPELSSHEINLNVLEEIERGQLSSAPDRAFWLARPG